ncbi:MAG: T9SS type A sorting domain-containing protein [Saprospiraceae bacterium]|nr:T9SS type A sorting domain-containing protein [Saprospiraceae bacterium]
MKNLLYTLFFTLAYKFVIAAHVLGGYWEYHVQSLKQDRFTLEGSFNLLRSSITAFDLEIQIGIYLKKNNTWKYVGTKKIKLNTISNRIKNTPVICSDANFELEKGAYDFKFVLPKQDGDYMFVYLRCCRNYNAVNLDNPGNAGSAFHLIITKAGQEKAQSSPTVNPNLNFILEYNRLDSVKLFDSLSLSNTHHFSWYNPWSAGTKTVATDCENPIPTHPCLPPYTLINYKAQYAFNKVFGTNSYSQLDPRNGTLHYKIDHLGSFLIGIESSIIDSGIVLSSSAFELQLFAEYGGSISTTYQGNIFYDKNKNQVFDRDETLLSSVLHLKNDYCNLKYNSNLNHYELIVKSDEENEIYIENEYWEINSLDKKIKLDKTNFGSTLSVDIPLSVKKSAMKLDQAFHFKSEKCGQAASYHYQIKNTGTVPAESNLLIVNLPSSFSFTNCSKAFTIINKQIHVALDKLEIGQQSELEIEFNTPSPFFHDSSYKSSFILISGNYRDTLHHFGIINCVVESNKTSKTVSPERKGMNIMNLNEELIYTINFQNNTNKTIQSFVVEDQLDEDLDFNTFSPIAASHPYKMETTPKKFILFLFDSTNLAPNENGFITFKIFPKQSAKRNFYLSNIAKISFPNQLIYTNSVSNYISADPIIDSSYNGTKIVFQPNPVYDEIILKFLSNYLNDYGSSYEIYDSQSKKIMSGNLFAKYNRLNLRHLANGIYFIKLKSRFSQASFKFIKIDAKF